MMVDSVLNSYALVVLTKYFPEYLHLESGVMITFSQYLGEDWKQPH